MSLVAGDIHGNEYKAKCFLEYKPEEQHVFVGDYFDSYVATDEQIVKTFKMIADSNALMCYGNHELHYLSNAHQYFKCSGIREKSVPLFTHLLSSYKDRLKASFVVDDYLIVHGGLHKKLGEVFDTVEQANTWINGEMDWYVNSPVIPVSLSSIFNIGAIRGGNDAFGGIFWFTYGFEEMSNRFNIICGHTPSTEIRIKEVDTMTGIKKHICIDNPKFMCYNTITHMVEDYMPTTVGDQMRSIYERNY
jgi:hypothetical protein